MLGYLDSQSKRIGLFQAIITKTDILITGRYVIDTNTDEYSSAHPVLPYRGTDSTLVRKISENYFENV